MMLADVALSEPTVTGDRAAWKEVGDAYAKLEALPGYRMRLVMTGEPPDIVVEVLPPGSVRMTTPTPLGSMETVSVNGQSRFRFNAPGAPGAWVCQGSPSIEFPTNPARAIQGTVDVSRGRSAIIEGSGVRTYIYRYAATVQGRPVHETVTLYVGTQTGLPRRAVTSDEQRDATIDFYDYGAKLSIQLPPCPGG